MSSSPCYAEVFRRLYVEDSFRDSPGVQEALERLPGLPVHWVRDKDGIPPEHNHPDTLWVCRPRGDTVTRCPGSRGHLCCGYLTVDLYLGCPLGCRYCIMRSYLNFSPITVYLDPGPSIERLASIARQNPDRMIRAGTGEVGDSLLLDPVFRLSESFVRALAGYPNLYFEMKTKTSSVDHLLDIPHKGKAVIGFSLNPQEIVEACEGIAASLDERLAAAERAAAAGYLLSFHFDPLILFPGWRDSYGKLVQRLLRFPPERIAWISLGTMRYPPELKDTLLEEASLVEQASKPGSEPRLPQDTQFDSTPGAGGRLFLEEFVPCRDGKHRYLQKTRSAMYRHLVTAIEPLHGVPVYLCMESPAVWRNVFGTIPGKKPSTRGIFESIRDL
jgi:spore photoproduct lyase